MSGPVSCQTCGETWPRHPALEVTCPTCRAPIGEACRKPSGHNRWEYEGPHVAHEQLAVDEGLMSVCSQGPTARGKPIAGQLPLFEASP